MNTKSISDEALSVIDRYLHFKIANAVCSIPYFNNKTIRARAALRTYIGKGSLSDISDEIQSLIFKNHVDKKTITDESLKKFLIDNNIGIECSGFTYYVLDAESKKRNKGNLKKHLRFVNCHGIIGKIRCSLRPIENCDVATFSSNQNSHTVSINDVNVGDMITMTGNIESDEATLTPTEMHRDERDHILVIHKIDYDNSIPKTIYYSHAVAYPEDGVYGGGIRQGEIKVSNLGNPITTNTWIEDGKTAENNRLFTRATKSKTEIRRLNWF